MCGWWEEGVDRIECRKTVTKHHFSSHGLFSRDSGDGPVMRMDESGGSIMKTPPKWRLLPREPDTKECGQILATKADDPPRFPTTESFQQNCLLPMYCCFPYCFGQKEKQRKSMSSKPHLFPSCVVWKDCPGTNEVFFFFIPTMQVESNRSVWSLFPFSNVLQRSPRRTLDCRSAFPIGP